MTAVLDSNEVKRPTGLNATYARKGEAGGLSVTAFGALGEGGNDTDAFASAVLAANGRAITVPPGVYGLSNMVVPVGMSAHFVLDPAATLVHLAAPASHAAIAMQGDAVTIHGGMIDGNWSAHTSRDRHFVRGEVQAGKRIGLYGVKVRRTLQTAVDARVFGGTLEIIDCEVREQAEHTGVHGEHTMIARVANGQEGAPGLVRFNGNRCYGTITPAVVGGSPGGIFCATNGFVEGAPGSPGFAVGNKSHMEALGNYFEGYGQHVPASNDISPIHTYPSWASVRIVGNHFEGCGYSAISTKCAEGITITGNTILNGQVNEGNTAAEGAIAAAMGYQAGGTERTHCIVSDNIIRNPGGETAALLQNGIQVRGLSDALAGKVTVTGNVVSGGGTCIRIMNAYDVVVGMNRLEASGTGNRGIDLTFFHGMLTLSSNQIKVDGAEGILTYAGGAEADVMAVGNQITSAASGFYAINIKGVRTIKLGDNLIRNTAATNRRAIYVGAQGAAKVGLLDYSTTNTVIGGGTVSFQWADIVQASGALVGSGAPENVVTAAPGTTYIDTSGPAGERVMWIKTRDSTNRWWVAPTAPATASSATMSTAAGRLNSTDKYEGKPCYDVTGNRALWASGPAATDPWVDANGTVVITPA